MPRKYPSPDLSRLYKHSEATHATRSAHGDTGDASHSLKADALKALAALALGLGEHMLANGHIPSRSLTLAVRLDLQLFYSGKMEGGRLELVSLVVRCVAMKLPISQRTTLCQPQHAWSCSKQRVAPQSTAMHPCKPASPTSHTRRRGWCADRSVVTRGARRSWSTHVLDVLSDLLDGGRHDGR